MDDKIFGENFIQYVIPAASEYLYPEIHPDIAVNIDSVNINTSLIMIRECIVSFGIQFHFTVLHAIALLALAHGLCLARRLFTS